MHPPKVKLCFAPLINAVRFLVGQTRAQMKPEFPKRIPTSLTPQPQFGPPAHPSRSLHITKGTVNISLPNQIKYPNPCIPPFPFPVCFESNLHISHNRTLPPSPAPAHPPPRSPITITKNLHNLFPLPRCPSALNFLSPSTFSHLEACLLLD
jgi:hypothetical protein